MIVTDSSYLPISLFTLERNRERIFVDCMGEIRQRNNRNKSVYGLVRRSAILRMLLTEGTPFYQLINRKYKIKFELPIIRQEFRGEGITTTKEVANTISYTYKYSISETGEQINLQSFLKFTIIEIINEDLKKLLHLNKVSDTYTVSDIIKLIANCHGGVHFDEWKGQVPSSLMTERSSPFNINTNSFLYDVLQNITEIVIIYLTPLWNEVVKSLMETKPLGVEASKTVKVIKSPKK